MIGFLFWGCTLDTKSGNTNLFVFSIHFVCQVNSVFVPGPLIFEDFASSCLF